MSARWGTPDERRLPALLETAGHSTTALLLAILMVCGVAMALTL